MNATDTSPAIEHQIGDTGSVMVRLSDWDIEIQAVDGDTGEVFINPSADTLTRHQKRRSESRANFEVFPPVPQLKVMADIGCVEDISGGSVGACGGYRPLSHGDQSTCSRATAQ